MTSSASTPTAPLRRRSTSPTPSSSIRRASPFLRLVRAVPALGLAGSQAHGTFARRHRPPRLRRGAGLRRPVPAARSTPSAGSSARAPTTRASRSPAIPAAVGNRWRRGRPHASIPTSARSTTSDALVAAARRAGHRDRARHRVPGLARPPVGHASIPSGSAQRPDGTIQYAENPPKKYQDIYPFDFESSDWRGAVAGAQRRLPLLDRAGRAASSASTTRTPRRSRSGSGASRDVKRDHPGGDVPRRGVHAAAR